MNELYGVVIFSKTDKILGYHHTIVKFEDISKTTFRPRYGYYEFLVMPFGVTNNLVVFMEYMNHIFKFFLDKFVVVFIDDILIYSCSLEEKGYLECSKRKTTLCKVVKVKFWMPKDRFLGHAA